jgi:ABC-type Fe3+-siderophore transport system permease subunit
MNNTAPDWLDLLTVLIVVGLVLAAVWLVRWVQALERSEETLQSLGKAIPIRTWFVLFFFALISGGLPALVMLILGLVAGLWSAAKLEDNPFESVRKRGSSDADGPLGGRR